MAGVKQSSYVLGTLISGLLLLVVAPFNASAATPDNNFSLQVSPSPLVTTVKPGEKKVLELKIRNSSTKSEDLKIQARSFKFDTLTGKVNLDETTPPEINDWLSFSAPRFSVGPGEWYTQRVSIDLPAQTGFSYSFALLINRNALPTPTQAGQLLNGSVAVFTLVNVDRPGATRSVELSSLTTSQSIYEYLPAKIDVRLKNTGNTIVQPYGNVFINRGGDTANMPSATLPLNDARAYLLPGTERTLQATWDDGFPVYKTAADAGGVQHTELSWNWDKVSHFKFGRYTAKVVAVYNDGIRDVPITRDITFWVIPWKAMLLLIVVVVGLILLLRFYIRRRTQKAVAKALAAQKKP